MPFNRFLYIFLVFVLVYVSIRIDIIVITASYQRIWNYHPHIIQHMGLDNMDAPLYNKNHSDEPLTFAPQRLSPVYRHPDQAVVRGPQDRDFFKTLAAMTHITGGMSWPDASKGFSGESCPKGTCVEKRLCGNFKWLHTGFIAPHGSAPSTLTGGIPVGVGGQIYGFLKFTSRLFYIQY